ncbi:hypothetical protein METHB2_430025 [Candidatus Methylobacter favarea]|uniref:Uncharacterized protein n=1 Tax=Candidatus Methylobacter favarea TaxID=2707345 RepID=A0A8S0XTF3_9GAMM|nr:hypothetical protein METHB2_430025 [Candidatus Methylobacter favarea]
MYQGWRRNLLLAHFIIDALAPVALASLLAKSLLPKFQYIKTRLLFNSIYNAAAAL